MLSGYYGFDNGDDDGLLAINFNLSLAERSLLLNQI